MWGGNKGIFRILNNSFGHWKLGFVFNGPNQLTNPISLKEERKLFSLGMCPVLYTKEGQSTILLFSFGGALQLII